MDGTLVDTFSLIYESFNYGLKKNGKRLLTKEEFDKKLFGKPIDPTIHQLIGSTSSEELQAIMRDFQSHWIRNLYKIKVFNTVPLTLERLKAGGCKLGVVSTSPRGVIEETLRQTGIYKFFDIFIGEEDAINKKPHHEPVTNAVKMLGIQPKDAVFVGDTIYDIQAGKSAGCFTVFMLNKYNGDALERAKPDKVIKDLKDLSELV